MTNDWQPIETAPKDGTVVDLWAGSRLANCFWNQDPIADANDDDSCWCQQYSELPTASFSLADYDPQPTYWMKVPEEPK